MRDAMARAHGRRNLDVLERAIELHRMGSAGTRSGAEDAFLRLVRTEPLVNMELLGFEVDFRWPDQRLVVEVDGGQHALRTDADKARDGVLNAAGWTVLRFSDREVYEQPSGVARCLMRWPTATIASTAGSSSRPNSVSAYSTVGGEVGMTARVTRPSSASRRRRAERTLALMPWMSPRSSLKRRGPSRRYQTMLGVHAPPSSAMHSVSGQPSGGASTRLGR